MESEFKFRVNGKERSLHARGDTPILWVLRDELGLTGTKYGCGMAQCGACTVFLNNQPSRACMLPLSSVAGQNITTIEGLDSRVGEAVKKAWMGLNVPQCGYCQSGQVMAAAALLAKTKNPSDADIDSAMSGNICRCGTYSDIRRAIHSAAKDLA